MRAAKKMFFQKPLSLSWILGIQEQRSPMPAAIQEQMMLAVGNQVRGMVVIHYFMNEMGRSFGKHCGKCGKTDMKSNDE
jgi:hypothetical protein